MIVGIILSENTHPIVIQEYKNFGMLLQSEINKKFSKDESMIILPIDKELLENVRKVDVIVLTGGSDVHPEYYNSKVKYSDNLYTFDKERDEIELEIINRFYQQRPIFGICRGIQILNVFFKGTLFQHLPYDLRGITIENAHKIYPEIQKFEKKRELRHIIKGKIFDILSFNKEEDRNKFMCVNSRHHQAIAKLGKDLEILALSKDGVVEIVKHTTLPILAVQYHPEQEEIIPYQLPLIRYFVNLL
ncbi:MAG: gamma-glutamyl-gamma-aminobutyrate hydrolase family protein [Candidatus Calescibacterium sp.]|nr:gamma-glutamyl-gamma-aminobutyrate hydrolase family protein [Candidatus Calescibacterium sp.]MCX7972376.1 gamma-glutamyl-gamma-aminobutyrate hydrolase family protein [bacterium]MDW8195733.1 gamma-glutamyl-gamma-aminobutyrate hydrolase family protein [Candidatus Calescibacterium sp.]